MFGIKLYAIRLDRGSGVIAQIIFVNKNGSKRHFGYFNESKLLIYEI